MLSKRDSDGDWVEGAPADRVYLPSVAAGRYHLVIDPETNAPALRWGFRLRRDVPRALYAWVAVGLLLVPPLVLWYRTGRFEHQRWQESADEIILARSSPYQRIVLTRWADDVRLFLNGHLQFSSRDEYRYHEALVHPALAAHPAPARVLVLGGGDGLAVREILRYAAVRSVTLVDLDPAMTRLFATNPLLTSLNRGALRDPRVSVVNADAFVWLAGEPSRFDVVIADLPDPHTFSLGKLYSRSFYRLLRARLAPGGLAAVQATSPLFARRSFWCIVETIRSAGLHARPYHVYVPSFGEWGFVLLATADYRPPPAYPPGLRFLTVDATPALFSFPPDMAAVPVEVNRLDNQVLVHYYGAEWQRIAPTLF